VIPASVENTHTHTPCRVTHHAEIFGWLRSTVVERWYFTGELFLSCARPAADG